jgi:GNAT superfamily N-acetyltransferase
MRQYASQSKDYQQDSPNILNITDLYVKHEYRNQSYGTKLLEQAIQLARDRHCEFITLDDCSDRFKLHHNIYIKLGFKYIDLNFPEMILIIKND